MLRDGAKKQMVSPISRRDLLKFGAAVFPVGVLGAHGNLATPLLGLELPGEGGDAVIISDSFPAQPAELVREMVTVAHFDLKRVKELVETRPALVKAAWDWGFGDWETPLGAASHMGNRAIAEYLVEQGAPPTLFSAVMLGQLDVVKALVAARPGVQRVRGPHSISLLAHARMGGEVARAVFDFLKALDGADTEAPVPLSSDETAALVGTYAFGVGVTQQVEVGADLRMYAGSKMYTYSPQLNWTRKGTMTRPLFHLGGREFYPAGAPAVRIRFAEVADGVALRVTDGEMEMSAIRKGKG